MDYSKITETLFRTVDSDSVGEILEKIQDEKHVHDIRSVCETCFRSLDLTSLGDGNTVGSIAAWARLASELRVNFPSVPLPATLCVHPVFVDTVGMSLGESDLGITSVAGGFPTGKTFLEVKMLECAMAEENGADEIDIVLNIEAFMEGSYNVAANEIEMIRRELDDQTVLKVIVESGLFTDLSDVYNASVLALSAGADFVKTSTGKTARGATPEAVAVMCMAIKDFFTYSGRQTGIKVSGGIRTEEDALTYYSIVRQLLGEEWISPSYFRIGASSLADRLLSVLEGKTVRYFGE